MRSPPRTFLCLTLGAMLALGALTIAAPPAAAETLVEVMVLGETHGTKSMTRTLVGIADDKGATGCICTGDLTYGDSSATPAGWRSMMTPFMGNMMPTQGNHDWPWSDWSGMYPNGAHYYAKDLQGVHVIVLNTEYSLASGSPQRVWLESELAERDPSELKIVSMHRPWWLPTGARHTSDEFQSKNGASASTMDALMVKYGVDLVTSGHEKNYQHSLRNGVHYLVAGGGGPTFYPMSYDLPGAQKRLLANAVSTLEIGSTSMTLKSYKLDGTSLEQFTMAEGATGTPAPTTTTTSTTATTSTTTTTTSAGVTFTPKGGNEWWVQVAVSGSPTKVEARDTNGAWVPLAKKSWGDWAASFRVESGHDVQYRATTSSGIAESCWYDHPSSACASPAPSPSPATGVTFTPKGGNGWWVQVAVSGSPTKVEARDTNGAWVTLAKKSWGDWAGSFRVETGHTVQYRATTSAGVAESCWYTHPGGACT